MLLGEVFFHAEKPLRREINKGRNTSGARRVSSAKDLLLATFGEPTRFCQRHYGDRLQ